MEFWKKISTIENIRFKYLIVLLPTQPFRSQKDFKKGIKFLKKGYPVLSFKNLDRSRKYIFEKLKNNFVLNKNLHSTNRQYLKTNFTPCGCFYMVKFSEFLKQKIFFLKKSKYIITEFPNNLDIDKNQDLNIAKVILKSKFKF